MPKEIKAKAKFYETGIDQECDMTFEYENEVKAALKSSVIQDTPTTAVIEFEKASVKLNYQFHAPTSFVIKTAEGEETKEFGVTTNGYNFEAEHVQEMLWDGKTESSEMTFEKSLQLIDLLDKVRAEIGLKYE
jgi:predicted dehydrogenase